MRALFALMLVLLLSACDAPTGQPSAAISAPAGKALPIENAQTLSVVERDGYRIVDLKGAVINWGGGAQGPKQHARLVLVPRVQKPPALTGDLKGATLIRTPVERVAVNMTVHEAMLTALGVDDRLVAVGGTFSYDDEVRSRVKSKQIKQIGYGWHSPPAIDVLLAARPEVFVMAMGDLDHLKHLDSIRALGVPVVPTFLDSETDYMGRVAYVRLIGLLTGREREAEKYVRMVGGNVARLKALVADRPKRSFVWAWFGGGDKWGATVRNADAQIIRDAGAVNLLEQPDDAAMDGMMWKGTERMLVQAAGAECWLIRDDHSVNFKNEEALSRFRAFREGCLLGLTGSGKPDANAYDYYDRGPLRPDLVLADLIALLHPELGVSGGTYILPDGKKILG